MKNGLKPVLFWSVRIGLVSGFLYIIWNEFQWERFVQAGAQMLHHPILLCLIFVGYFVSFYLKAWAWKLYFKGQISISTALYGIFYSLLINHLAPIKVGDVVRAMVLSTREQQVHMEKSFHSVFVLRLLDIASLLLLSSIGVFMIGKNLTIPVGTFLTVGILGVITLLIVIWKSPRFIKRNVQFLCDAVKGWNGLMIASLVLLSWILEGAVLLGMAQILMVEMGILEGIWANSITIIGQSFQFTPGGLTTYEAIMTYALSILDISTETGLMIAIFSHGFKFMFAYLLGIIVYILYPLRLNKLKGWVRLKGVKQNEKRIKI
ncbi:flippase-like domain-containing protein [Cytobacillus spongiae]|jgi:uncharacterized membrane protein YbhN (UPF0104 family)|uniref:lysylphosphatidylglycerol synthase transmembrane domain-containing protein n=1 Tax=Cytobacillus spongiae TaxID=2901381 RepID=UPI001F3863F6|nr:lysylphosphatidylglycerol synthase transmembrane domain-containing protein [Cytobacillus spongiae]UII55108.1 flippase-like domain-containing protein [Cytobacillus spongiae]